MRVDLCPYGLEGRLAGDPLVTNARVTVRYSDGDSSGSQPSSGGRILSFDTAPVAASESRKGAASPCGVVVAGGEASTLIECSLAPSGAGGTIAAVDAVGIVKRGCAESNAALPFAFARRSAVRWDTSTATTI